VIASKCVFSIYLTRKGISSYYNYRIDVVTQRLEIQQAERSKTINKLKAATKYDSTQELLEKYGGATPAPTAKKAKVPSKGPTATPVQRTGTGPPPPTANIPRPGSDQITTTPNPATPESGQSVAATKLNSQSPTSPSMGSAEFAPNAFSGPAQYAGGSTENIISGHWYDRVLDLLMGEDETSARNRMVLICQHCRLVNGQAPPGTRSAIELGRWRCGGCGGWNGEEDEAMKVVQEMKEKIEQQPLLSGTESDELHADGDKILEGPDQQGNESDFAEDVVEVKPRKGRPKGSKKKL
jgi:hypothetical protein